MMSDAVAAGVQAIATRPESRRLARWCMEALSDDMADLAKDNVYLADRIARRPGDFGANVQNFLGFVNGGCTVWPDWAAAAEDAHDKPMLQLVAARSALLFRDSDSLSVAQ